MPLLRLRDRLGYSRRRTATLGDRPWGVVQLAGFWVLVPAMRVQVPPPQFRDGAVRSVCEHLFVSSNGLGPRIGDGDLHWLAGLLEGEGSFLTAPPSAPRSPALQVSMVDRDVIERAGALLGSSVAVIPARREGWRTAYSVRVRGRPAVLWMRRLRPLMGARRRGQIDRALASHGSDPTRRLDDQRATQALEGLAGGESVGDVAKRFGCSVWCIYDLRLGRTHRHLGRPAGLAQVRGGPG